MGRRAAFVLTAPLFVDIREQIRASIKAMLAPINVTLLNQGYILFCYRQKQYVDIDERAQGYRTSAEYIAFIAAGLALDFNCQSIGYPPFIVRRPTILLKLFINSTVARAVTITFEFADDPFTYRFIRFELAFLSPMCTRADVTLAQTYSLSTIVLRVCVTATLCAAALVLPKRHKDTKFPCTQLPIKRPKRARVLREVLGTGVGRGRRLFDQDFRRQGFCEACSDRERTATKRGGRVF